MHIPALYSSTDVAPMSVATPDYSDMESSKKHFVLHSLTEAKYVMQKYSRAQFDDVLYGSCPHFILGFFFSSLFSVRFSGVFFLSRNLL